MILKKTSQKSKVMTSLPRGAAKVRKAKRANKRRSSKRLKTEKQESGSECCSMESKPTIASNEPSRPLKVSNTISQY